MPRFGQWLGGVRAVGIAACKKGLEARVGLSRIVEKGGCLISEQRLGTPRRAPYLVARDRIQSGLSLATVVVQTDLAGGSMHTAAFALRQGRKLFAFGREPMDATELWNGNAFLLEKEPAQDDARFGKLRRPGKPLAQRLEPGTAARTVLAALKN